MNHDKQHAEQICSVLNLCFGWRGADSQWSRDAGYTGRVVLSPLAAQEVVDLQDRLKDLEARIIDLAPRTRPVARNGNGDVMALLSLQEDTGRELSLTRSKLDVSEGAPARRPSECSLHSAKEVSCPKRVPNHVPNSANLRSPENISRV